MIVYDQCFRTTHTSTFTGTVAKTFVASYLMIMDSLYRSRYCTILVTPLGCYIPGTVLLACLVTWNNTNDHSNTCWLLLHSGKVVARCYVLVVVLLSIGHSESSNVWQDMVRLLLDSRFRTRDEGRSFVLLSLAEAARGLAEEPWLRKANIGWLDRGLLVVVALLTILDKVSVCEQPTTS